MCSQNTKKCQRKFHVHIAGPVSDPGLCSFPLMLHNLHIPEYEDIFNDDNPKEQCFITNVMLANLKKKKETEEDI